MQKIFRYTLVLAALAAALPAAAQPGGRPPAGPPRGALPAQAERHAFDALLRHRERLELSADQVRRLEAIAARLEERNRPLRERLRQERERFMETRRQQLERLTPEQRRDTLRAVRRRGQAAVPESMQPLVRQMRVHVEEATYEAQGVLTAEQRLRARRILQQEMRMRARRPG
ncbi:MAG TPA: hypothetical protein VFQ45_12805, partial [Longimicrobium sp.]|nr:hypothetical protein [Longimicrobium sp.]